MAEITFSHPHVQIQSEASVAQTNGAPPSVHYAEDNSTGSTLSIDIRPNQIVWAYGLNTATFPTYAGEVVQILSAYVDNLTIEGDVRSYLDMELVHKWFIAYMIVATQGNTGAPVNSTTERYNEEPVQFAYPHRNWKMKIRPLSLPAFTYGTDVIVPSWSLEAAVVEDETLEITTFTNRLVPEAVEKGLTTLNASFGAGLQNPFNYYDGTVSKAAIDKYIIDKSEPIVNPNSEQLQNWFSKLVANASHGEVNLGAYATAFSKPVTSRSDASQTVESRSNQGVLGGLGELPFGAVGDPPVQLTPGEQAKIQSNGTALAPSNAPHAVQNAIGAGNQINTKPYVFGGGHGVDLNTIQAAYDCSGATSYLLFKAGLLGSQALATPELGKWGEAGVGKWITVYVNPDPGEHGHAFIVVAGIAFDTVPGANGYAPPSPADGGKWYPASEVQYHINTDDPLMQPRHYPGL